MRQRACRLSKPQSISGRRGNVVDQVLSSEVIPAIERGRQIRLTPNENKASKAVIQA